MELTLKDRKAINNGKYNLPKFENGLNSIPDNFEKELGIAQKIGGIASALPTFAKDVVSAFTTDATVDKFLADAGTFEGSVGGIKYNRINSFKCGKLPKHTDGLNSALSTASSGAAVGSAFGPWGAAIGGVAGGMLGGIGSIFASDEEERIKNEARKKRLAINQFNFDGAMSQYMQMKEQEDLSKPMYAEGKQPNVLPKGFVITSNGIERGTPNSLVQPEEKIQKVKSGKVVKQITVPGNPEYGDVVPAKLGDRDSVITLKGGLADMADVDPDLALQAQASAKKAGILKQDNKSYKCGKLPKHNNGWLPNVITNGLSGLIGLGQYLSARNEDVKNPNTYVSNPYEGTALRGLAGLQYNPYPIINQMKNRQAYFNYGLANSGGLSGAQKYLGRIANANNMYKATADMMAGLQERNLGLRSSYYNTMANLGAQQAQRRQAANQYDLDYYSKAHAARQQAMNTGLYNMINSAQSIAANQFKYDQFMRTLALYQQDLNNRA